MKATARLSWRSKPRRFGISSRKSVSAEACSSSIRASALANSAFNRRIVDRWSAEGVAGREVGVALRRGAAFCPADALLGRFGPFEAVPLVFFVMAFPVQARL